MPRVAVVLSDLLRRAGLAAMLERYFAPVEVECFAAVDDALREERAFDLYFPDGAVFAAEVDFFLPRRAQCVILTEQSAAGGAAGETPCVVSTCGTLEEVVERIGQVWRDDRPEEERASTELSGREIEVLRSVVSGAINKEIADRLHISLNTVLTHRRNITAKLGIKTVSGLTLYALMHGYISAEDMPL